MKRFIITIFAAALFLPALKSQESTFNKGDKVVNIGIGLGSTLYTGSYYTSTVPPLSVSFEQGVKDNIFDKGVLGVGGYLGYSSYKYKIMDWGYKYSDIIIGARGVFHYPLLAKLDTYTGLMLGYEILTNKEFGDWGDGSPYKAASGGIAWSWYVGGRYYFTDKFAAMAELGYGISYLTLGVSIKL